MFTSINGLNLIKECETCVLTAYPDPFSVLGRACTHLGVPLTEYTRVPRWQLLNADPITIGWGHTRKSLKLGDHIDQPTADAFLAIDVKWAEAALAGLSLNQNQNQFDACVSLVFNIGAGNFLSSTLRRLLQSFDFADAALEFVKWDHADHQVSNGLLRRRERERDLFLQPC